MTGCSVSSYFQGAQDRKIISVGWSSITCLTGLTGLKDPGPAAKEKSDRTVSGLGRQRFPSGAVRGRSRL